MTASKRHSHTYQFTHTHLSGRVPTRTTLNVIRRTIIGQVCICKSNQRNLFLTSTEQAIQRVICFRAWTPVGCKLERGLVWQLIVDNTKVIFFWNLNRSLDRTRSIGFVRLHVCRSGNIFNLPLSFEPFSYTNFIGTNYRTVWYTKTNTSISSLILQLRYDNNRDTIKIPLHSFQGR